MTVLRVLTLNLWGEQGPVARRMEVCAAGLKAIAPDVVALQEVREVEGKLPNQAATLAAGLLLKIPEAPGSLLVKYRRAR